MKELTSKEMNEVITAVGRTWQAIAGDALELGVSTLEEAAELVLDAGRIVGSGGLRTEVYERLLAENSWDEVVAFLDRNRGQWY